MLNRKLSYILVVAIAASFIAGAATTTAQYYTSNEPIKQKAVLSGDNLPKVTFPTWQETYDYLQSQEPEELFTDFTQLTESLRGTPVSIQSATEGDMMFVTWSQNHDIYLSLSYDGGKTFTKPVNLSANEGSSMNPTIAAVGNNVMISWEDTTPGVSHVYLSQSIDGGKTWKSYDLSGGESTNKAWGVKAYDGAAYPVLTWNEEKPDGQIVLVAHGRRW